MSYGIKRFSIRIEPDIEKGIDELRQYPEFEKMAYTQIYRELLRLGLKEYEKNSKKTDGRTA